MANHNPQKRTISLHYYMLDFDTGDKQTDGRTQDTKHKHKHTRHPTRAGSRGIEQDDRTSRAVVMRSPSPKSKKTSFALAPVTSSLRNSLVSRSSPMMKPLAASNPTSLPRPPSCATSEKANMETVDPKCGDRGGADVED